MKILIVEDEKHLGMTLCALLEQQGYTARWAETLTTAWDAFAELEPDLVVLDVMLPESDDAGFEFTQGLREMGHQVPILLLTARDGSQDKVLGLDTGADDYMVKPIVLDEFLARVRALLRRTAGTKQAVFKAEDLQVDFDKRRILWAEKEVNLTRREFALLEQLTLNPERIYSPSELLERIFPDVDSGTDVVRVYVHYLRQKLGKQVVKTTQHGYKLGLQVSS